MWSENPDGEPSYLNQRVADYIGRYPIGDPMRLASPLPHCAQWLAAEAALAARRSALALLLASTLSWRASTARSAADAACGDSAWPAGEGVPEPWACTNQDVARR